MTRNRMSHAEKLLQVLQGKSCYIQEKGNGFYFKSWITENTENGFWKAEWEKIPKMDSENGFWKVTNITEQKTDFELNKKRIFKWKITK